jgi:hypothetical protein
MKTFGNLVLMTLICVGIFILFMGVRPAPAQTPGWRETGYWQCGPYVKIITSIDGFGGMDFLVVGAWFDNHYTLRGNGELYYNGVLCMPFGKPQPLYGPLPIRPKKASDEELDK